MEFCIVQSTCESTGEGLGVEHLAILSARDRLIFSLQGADITRSQFSVYNLLKVHVQLKIPLSDFTPNVDGIPYLTQLPPPSGDAELLLFFDNSQYNIIQ